MDPRVFGKFPTLWLFPMHKHVINMTSRLVNLTRRRQCSSTIYQNSLTRWTLSTNSSIPLNILTFVDGSSCLLGTSWDCFKMEKGSWWIAKRDYHEKSGRLVRIDKFRTEEDTSSCLIRSAFVPNKYLHDHWYLLCPVQCNKATKFCRIQHSFVLSVL